MRYSLIRSLLSEEYGIARDTTLEPNEHVVDPGSGPVVIGFFPEIGRFKMRGFIFDPSRHENYIPFESYTTLDVKGGAKTVVFKLPGNPMTSEFNDGDRTSIARIGRNAMMLVYDGSSPSRPRLRDLIDQHSPDVLVQTASGFDTRPPRVSREEREALKQEIEALYDENNEISDYIESFPGMASDPDIAARRQEIRDRVSEIAIRLNLKIT